MPCILILQGTYGTHCPLSQRITYEHDTANQTIAIGDVFCGAGGLTLGVSQAIRALGFKPRHILAADIDSWALNVFRRNFDPLLVESGDLWTLVTKSFSVSNSTTTFSAEPQLLSCDLQEAKGQIDILLGSPPCGGHSSSNSKTIRNDPKNKYYLAMPALAVALKAKCVIVENVPGIFHDAMNVLERARSLFLSSGYHVQEMVIDAISLGLPQTRKRHFLIASQHLCPSIETAIKVINRPNRNLRWAIGDLIDVESVNAIDSWSELSAENKRRVDYLFDNDEYDLPNSQRPDSHKAGHTYPSIYGRLHWKMPAGTLTTGFNSPGRGRYIHPSRRRTITPHEAARIQGFPDEFEFQDAGGDTPGRTILGTLIGNAVPPPMGYASGIAALASMDLSGRNHREPSG